MNEKTDVHVFVWRATPAIQYARRFFHSDLKETKKINNQFLSDSQIIMETALCETDPFKPPLI